MSGLQYFRPLLYERSGLDFHVPRQTDLEGANAAHASQTFGRVLFQAFSLPDTPLTSWPPAHSLHVARVGGLYSPPQQKPELVSLPDSGASKIRHSRQRSVDAVKRL